MRMLLLAATLGALAASPASAHGHVPAIRPAASAFDIKIILHDAPKVAHYRPAHRWHLRPQPWPRHFHHHAPRSSWHKPWRPAPRHFDRDRGDHRRWSHGPWRPDGKAFRHAPARKNPFGHGRPDQRRRHR
jgi:hypothetical protein